MAIEKMKKLKLFMAEHLMKKKFRILQLNQFMSTLIPIYIIRLTDLSKFDPDNFDNETIFIAVHGEGGEWKNSDTTRK